MSGKERPRTVGGGGGGGGADGEDDGETTETGDPKEKKCTGCGGKGKKKMSFFRLRKGKKVEHQKRKQKGIYVNSGCWGRRVVGGCLNQSGTLDSSGESPTSDPNSSEFTFDTLRALIEKNDFYSKECNPHLDADV